MADSSSRRRSPDSSRRRRRERRAASRERTNATTADFAPSVAGPSTNYYDASTPKPGPTMQDRSAPIDMNSRSYRGRPGSSSSGSSSTSSSLLDISRRYSGEQKRGGVFQTFFRASGDRRRLTRRRSGTKKKTKKRILYFGNSSSSSLNSDLAYGTGYIPRRKTSRDFSQRHHHQSSAPVAETAAAAAAGATYAATHNQGPLYPQGPSKHAPSHGHSQSYSHPPPTNATQGSSGWGPGAAATAAVAGATAAGLAADYYNVDNQFGDRQIPSKQTTPRRRKTDDEIMAIGRQLSGLAVAQNEGDLRAAGLSKPSGLVSAATKISDYRDSKYGRSRGIGGSKMRVDSSADDSDWESASDDDDSEDSADSNLAFGTVVSAAAAGAAMASGSRHQDSRSTVDPRLFGPFNSLHGMVTPRPFDDNGKPISREPRPLTRSATEPMGPMRNVYPMATSDPNRFDVSSTDLPHRARPGPVPLQQPTPRQTISPKVYDAEKLEDATRRIDKPSRRSEDSSNWGGVAAAGVAAGLVGAALTKDRKDDREDRDDAKRDREKRSERSDKHEKEREKEKDDKRKSKRDSYSSKYDDKEREKEREREKDEKRRSKRDSYSSKYADDKDRDEDRKRTSKHDDRKESKKSRDGDSYKRRDKEDVEDGRSELSRISKRDSSKYNLPAKYDKPQEARQIPGPEKAGSNQANDSDQPPLKSAVDPFKYQVEDFATAPAAEPPRPLTPNVFTVAREPVWDSTDDELPQGRLSRKDSFEIEQMVEENRKRQTPEERRGALDYVASRAAHAVAPVGVAAMAGAIVAENARSKDRKRDAYSDNGSEIRTSPRDAVQDDADRYYREAEVARKIVSDRVRSREPAPDRSIVDRYDQDDNVRDIPRIVTPPEYKPHEQKPEEHHADFKLDNRWTPSEAARYTAAFSEPIVDVEAEQARPYLNLIYPTPASSRKPTPAIEQQEEKSRSADRDWKDDTEKDRRSKDRSSKSRDKDRDEPSSRSDVGSSKKRTKDRDERSSKSEVGIGSSRRRRTKELEEDVSKSDVGAVVVVGSDGEIQTPKSVSWGENRTKTFEVVTPEPGQDRQLGGNKTRPQLDKSSQWGAIATAMAANGREPHNEPEYTESPTGMDDGSRSRDMPVYHVEDTPPVPGPKPASPGPQQMPGGFEDDIEFAATLAAGLEETGFDANMVIDDPTYRRRDSPPGSNELNGNGVHQKAFSEPVSEFHNREPQPGPDEPGFVLGEVETPGNSSRAIEPAGDWTEAPTKLSKKERKRQEKLKKQQEAETAFDTPVEAPEPPLAVEEPPVQLSKKEQRKLDKEAKARALASQEDEIYAEPEQYKEPDTFEDAWEEPSSSKKSRKSRDYDDGATSVSVPVDAFADLTSSRDVKPDDEWDDDKTSKRKSKRDSKSYDSVSKSVDDLALSKSSQPDDDFDELKKSSKKKSKRDSLIYDSPSRSVNDLSKIGDYEDEDDKKSKRKSKRDSGLYDSPSQSVNDLSNIDQDDDRDDSKSRRRSKRDSGAYDSPSRSAAASEAGSEISRKSSKKSKRRSGTEDDFKDYGDHPPDRGRDPFEDRDVSSVVSEPRDEKRSSRRSYRYEEDDDTKSVASAPGGGRKKVSEKRSSGGLFSSIFKKDDNKSKESFLDNAGTLGAGVGMAGVGIAVANSLSRHNATEPLSEKKDPSEEIADWNRGVQDEMDPGIVARAFKPAIDPQYGDLLPLPPSEPGTPIESPEDSLPGLPESRPDTPPEEQNFRHAHIRRKSAQETPMKSPSNTAIPFQLRLGNRSGPSSPAFYKSSPVTSPGPGMPESPGSTRKQRPTSWDDSREYRPLYLLEHNRQGPQEDPLDSADLPALPPSEASSRSSPGPGSEAWESADEYAQQGYNEADYGEPTLRLDTSLPAFTPGHEATGSQETTPKAEIRPEFPDISGEDSHRKQEPDQIESMSKDRSSYLLQSAPSSTKSNKTVDNDTVARNLQGIAETPSKPGNKLSLADLDESLTSADEHFSDAREDKDESSRSRDLSVDTPSEAVTAPETPVEQSSADATPAPEEPTEDFSMLTGKAKKKAKKAAAAAAKKKQALTLDVPAPYEGPESEAPATAREMPVEQPEPEIESAEAPVAKGLSEQPTEQLAKEEPPTESQDAFETAKKGKKGKKTKQKASSWEDELPVAAGAAAVATGVAAAFAGISDDDKDTDTKTFDDTNESAPEAIEEPVESGESATREIEEPVEQATQPPQEPEASAEPEAEAFEPVGKKNKKKKKKGKAPLLLDEEPAAEDKPAPTAEAETAPDEPPVTEPEAAPVDEVNLEAKPAPAGQPAAVAEGSSNVVSAKESETAASDEVVPAEAPVEPSTDDTWSAPPLSKKEKKKQKKKALQGDNSWIKEVEEDVPEPAAEPSAPELGEAKPPGEEATQQTQAEPESTLQNEISASTEAPAEAEEVPGPVSKKKKKKDKKKALQLQLDPTNELSPSADKALDFAEEPLTAIAATGDDASAWDQTLEDKQQTPQIEEATAKDEERRFQSEISEPLFSQDELSAVTTQDPSTQASDMFASEQDTTESAEPAWEALSSGKKSKKNKKKQQAMAWDEPKIESAPESESTPEGWSQDAEPSHESVEASYLEPIAEDEETPAGPDWEQYEQQPDDWDQYEQEGETPKPADDGWDMDDDFFSKPTPKEDVADDLGWDKPQGASTDKDEPSEDEWSTLVTGKNGKRSKKKKKAASALDKEPATDEKASTTPEDPKSLATHDEETLDSALQEGMSTPRPPSSGTDATEIWQEAESEFPEDSNAEGQPAATDDNDSLFPVKLSKKDKKKKKKQAALEAISTEDDKSAEPETKEDTVDAESVTGTTDDSPENTSGFVTPAESVSGEANPDEWGGFSSKKSKKEKKKKAKDLESEPAQESTPAEATIEGPNEPDSQEDRDAAGPADEHTATGDGLEEAGSSEQGQNTGLSKKEKKNNKKAKALAFDTPEDTATREAESTAETQAEDQAPVNEEAAIDDEWTPGASKKDKKKKKKKRKSVTFDLGDSPAPGDEKVEEDVVHADTPLTDQPEGEPTTSEPTEEVQVEPETQSEHGQDNAEDSSRALETVLESADDQGKSTPQGEAEEDPWAAPLSKKDKKKKKKAQEAAAAAAALNVSESAEEAVSDPAPTPTPDTESQTEPSVVEDVTSNVEGTLKPEETSKVEKSLTEEDLKPESEVVAQDTSADEPAAEHVPLAEEPLAEEDDESWAAGLTKSQKKKRKKQMEKEKEVAIAAAALNDSEPTAETVNDPVPASELDSQTELHVEDVPAKAEEPPTEQDQSPETDAIAHDGPKDETATEPVAPAEEDDESWAVGLTKSQKKKRKKQMEKDKEAAAAAAAAASEALENPEPAAESARAPAPEPEPEATLSTVEDFVPDVEDQSQDKEAPEAEETFVAEESLIPENPSPDSETAAQEAPVNEPATKSLPVAEEESDESWAVGLTKSQKKKRKKQMEKEKEAAAAAAALSETEPEPVAKDVKDPAPQFELETEASIVDDILSHAEETSKTEETPDAEEAHKAEESTKAEETAKAEEAPEAEDILKAEEPLAEESATPQSEAVAQDLLRDELAAEPTFVAEAEAEAEAEDDESWAVGLTKSQKKKRKKQMDKEKAEAAAAAAAAVDADVTTMQDEPSKSSEEAREIETSWASEDAPTQEGPEVPPAEKIAEKANMVVPTESEEPTAEQAESVGDLSTVELSKNDKKEKKKVAETRALDEWEHAAEPDKPIEEAHVQLESEPQPMPEVTKTLDEGTSATGPSAEAQEFVNEAESPKIEEPSSESTPAETPSEPVEDDESWAVGLTKSQKKKRKKQMEKEKAEKMQQEAAAAAEPEPTPEPFAKEESESVTEPVTKEAESQPATESPAKEEADIVTEPTAVDSTVDSNEDVPPLPEDATQPPDSWDKPEAPVESEQAKEVEPEPEKPGELETAQMQPVAENAALVAEDDESWAVGLTKSQKKKRKKQMEKERAAAKDLESTAAPFEEPTVEEAKAEPAEASPELTEAPQEPTEVSLDPVEAEPTTTEAGPIPETTDSDAPSTENASTLRPKEPATSTVEDDDWSAGLSKKEKKKKKAKALAMDWDTPTETSETLAEAAEPETAATPAVEEETVQPAEPLQPEQASQPNEYEPAETFEAPEAPAEVTETLTPDPEDNDDWSAGLSKKDKKKKKKAKALAMELDEPPQPASSEPAENVNEPTVVEALTETAVPEPESVVEPTQETTHDQPVAADTPEETPAPLIEDEDELAGLSSKEKKKRKKAKAKAEALAMEEPAEPQLSEPIRALEEETGVSQPDPIVEALHEGGDTPQEVPTPETEDEDEFAGLSNKEKKKRKKARAKAQALGSDEPAEPQPAESTPALDEPSGSPLEPATATTEEQLEPEAHQDTEVPEIAPESQEPEAPHEPEASREPEPANASTDAPIELSESVAEDVDEFAGLSNKEKKKRKKAKAQAEKLAETIESVQSEALESPAIVETPTPGEPDVLPDTSRDAEAPGEAPALPKEVAESAVEEEEDFAGLSSKEKKKRKKQKEKERVLAMASEQPEAGPAESKQGDELSAEQVPSSNPAIEEPAINIGLPVETQASSDHKQAESIADSGGAVEPEDAVNAAPPEDDWGFGFSKKDKKKKKKEKAKSELLEFEPPRDPIQPTEEQEGSRSLDQLDEPVPTREVPLESETAEPEKLAYSPAETAYETPAGQPVEPVEETAPASSGPTDSVEVAGAPTTEEQTVEGKSTVEQHVEDQPAEAGQPVTEETPVDALTESPTDNAQDEYAEPSADTGVEVPIDEDDWASGLSKKDKKKKKKDKARALAMELEPAGEIAPEPTPAEEPTESSSSQRPTVAIEPQEEFVVEPSPADDQPVPDASAEKMSTEVPAEPVVEEGSWDSGLSKKEKKKKQKKAVAMAMAWDHAAETTPDGNEGISDSKASETPATISEPPIERSQVTDGPAPAPEETPVEEADNYDWGFGLSTKDKKKLKKSKALMLDSETTPDVTTPVYPSADIGASQHAEDDSHTNEDVEPAQESCENKPTQPDDDPWAPAPSKKDKKKKKKGKALDLSAWDEPEPEKIESVTLVGDTAEPEKSRDLDAPQEPEVEPELQPEPAPAADDASALAGLSKKDKKKLKKKALAQGLPDPFAETGPSDDTPSGDTSTLDAGGEDAKPAELGLSPTKELTSEPADIETETLQQPALVPAGIEHDGQPAESSVEQQMTEAPAESQEDPAEEAQEDEYSMPTKKSKKDKKKLAKAAALATALATDNEHSAEASAETEETEQAHAAEDFLTTDPDTVVITTPVEDEPSQPTESWAEDSKEEPTPEIAATTANEPQTHVDDNDNFGFSMSTKKSKKDKKKKKQAAFESSASTTEAEQPKEVTGTSTPTSWADEGAAPSTEAVPVEDDEWAVPAKKSKKAKKLKASQLSLLEFQVGEGGQGGPSTTEPVSEEPASTDKSLDQTVARDEQIDTSFAADDEADNLGLDAVPQPRSKVVEVIEPHAELSYSANTALVEPPAQQTVDAEPEDSWAVPSKKLSKKDKKRKSQQETPAESSRATSPARDIVAAPTTEEMQLVEGQPPQETAPDDWLEDFGTAKSKKKTKKAKALETAALASDSSPAVGEAKRSTGTLDDIVAAEQDVPMEDVKLDEPVQASVEEPPLEDDPKPRSLGINQQSWEFPAETKEVVMENTAPEEAAAPVSSRKTGTSGIGSVAAAGAAAAGVAAAVDKTIPSKKGKKGKKNKKSIDKRQPQEDDIFDDPSLWESADKRNLQDEDDEKVDDAFWGEGEKTKGQLAEEENDDFWGGGEDETETKATESGEMESTREVDDFWGGQEPTTGRDLDRELTTPKPAETWAQPGDPTFEPQDTSRSLLAPRAHHSAEKDKEQSADKAKDLTITPQSESFSGSDEGWKETSQRGAPLEDYDDDSPGLGRGEQPTPRSRPAGLLRRGSDMEEPVGGLLREDNQALALSGPLGSDFGGTRLSPARSLPGIQEDPEAEEETSMKRSLLPQTPEMNRDSGYVESPRSSFRSRSRSHLFVDEPEQQQPRDSGYHADEWDESPARTTETPKSSKKLSRSSYGTPKLQEPAATEVTPEPEKKSSRHRKTASNDYYEQSPLGSSKSRDLRDAPTPTLKSSNSRTERNLESSPSLRSMKSRDYGDLRSESAKQPSSASSALPVATPSQRSVSDNSQNVGQPKRQDSQPQLRRSLSNTSLARKRTPEPLKFRPESPGIHSQGSGIRSTPTPPLRRVDKRVSGDLRSLRQQPSHPTLSSSTPTPDPAQSQSQPSQPVANEGRVRSKDMADVYDGFGEGRMGSPRSPTRPHSMRRRQSMQVLELESRVDQLVAENRLLTEARTHAEQNLSQRATTVLSERDSEIEALKQSLHFLQNEVSRLTEVNDGLSSANAELAQKDNGRYTDLEVRHADVSRELDEVRGTHNTFEQSIQDKDAEIADLRAQLEDAKEQVREMQRQILASKAGDADFLDVRDEDHFDNRCQQLCSHVQQWVLRFSKFSDMRACRLTSEINDEKTIDRLDNAVLDGSDVDRYLSDRVKRRDIFMSMTMNMIWEFVFTRYLFGMDREQRQKLKSLEKMLTEVGPPQAVRQWRAVTLTLLARRDNFRQQKDQDTEAVVQAIFQTLCKILPPPGNLETQIQSQLRRVLREAVDLSVEMRTQKAEYMMLPPLQPEYDSDGELAATVQFNASMMNERSGKKAFTNEDLENEGAVVRVVLFPLVVKKGDDAGVGDEEIVVCPAQVIVAGDKGRRPNSRSSDAGGASLGGRSHISVVTEHMGG